MPHESTVPVLPCAGTDGWAILAEPPGVRDLEDPRYWETSLDRSLRRRGTRPARLRARPQLQAAAVLALAAVGAPAAADASSQDLKRGSSGAAVRKLQTTLGIDADGAFGAQTEAAVRRFQRSHGLPVTGLVGPLTRAALAKEGTTAPDAAEGDPAPTKVTATSSQIRAIQRRLDVTVDGVIGPETRAAIKTFESSRGLPADGRLDAALLKALGIDGDGVETQQSEGTPGRPSPATGSKAQAAVEAALSKVGTPYRWGGAGPSSFDCSGLTMWAFGQAGIKLPHSSFAQYAMGQRVAAGQIQAGDLVFFDTAGAGASDVGIATSATTVVSATTRGVMTHSIKGAYWGSHFVGARRIA